LLSGYLVDEDQGIRVPVEGTVTIGRTKDCGFIIEDSAASRRHLQVMNHGARFTWKDLGSTNGTLVNGQRMLAGELKAGDRIQIGETVIRFESEETADPAPSAMSDSTLFNETIIDATGNAKQQHPDAKSAAILESLYKIVNEIAANYDAESLMDRILHMTMSAVGGQRGAIFLTDAAGKLPAAPVCQRDNHQPGTVNVAAGTPDVRISQTVARRVMEGGESVLYQDADNDSELNASESILSLKLNSIVCVPLRAKQRIIGILYIDTDDPQRLYNEDDLLLAAAVGNSAGLAIENARLYKESLDKQRMEQEIETAWTIQEGFLVKTWPDKDGRYRVYGETRPAKTVGGDFYDFAQINENTIALLIGDVSGKGVPAALTMAQLIAEFRLLARSFESPTEVISRLNGELSRRSRRGLFCTLCYLKIDLTSGKVICSNAGHHPVVRIGRDAVTEFGDATGPPAGILGEGPWHDTEQMLDAGDSLLLYTDGIIEARSMGTLLETEAPPEPEEYQLENLKKVARAHHGQNPKVLIEAVNHDVKRFCAPGNPHDDCTMLAVHYLGS
jgi:sigma-B regulation protein RsbU (phosphoserine phosphatase)